MSRPSSRPADWASDTRPSLPVAPIHRRVVAMGGFTFTPYGLALDISPEGVEELTIPPYSPSQKLRGQQ